MMVWGGVCVRCRQPYPCRGPSSSPPLPHKCLDCKATERETTILQLFLSLSRLPFYVCARLENADDCSNLLRICAIASLPSARPSVQFRTWTMKGRDRGPSVRRSQRCLFHCKQEFPRAQDVFAHEASCVLTLPCPALPCS